VLAINCYLPWWWLGTFTLAPSPYLCPLLKVQLTAKPTVLSC
jgi:hypothetical protein